MLEIVDINDRSVSIYRMCGVMGPGNRGDNYTEWYDKSFPSDQLLGRYSLSGVYGRLLCPFLCAFR